MSDEAIPATKPEGDRGATAPETGTRSGRTGRSAPTFAGLHESRLATAGLAVLVLFAAVAVLAPVLAPYEPGALHVSDRLEGPSAEYPLGTDRLGRDVLSRVLFGARVALTVAVAVPLAAASVGVPVGLVAGYVGGALDDALMRVMDAVFAFPSVLLGLTIVAVFGQGLSNIVLALGIVFVPQFARVTRGSAMSATAERHVTAARAMGASHTRVVAVHVLPFCASAILVQATVTAALAVILEASLSFLGVGVQPSTPSWGTMLREGKGYLETAPWYSLAPGVAIVLSVLGFNLLGDGLRDVLDPRSRAEQ